jgi:hypothetical protein
VPTAVWGPSPPIRGGLYPPSAGPVATGCGVPVPTGRECLYELISGVLFLPSVEPYQPGGWSVPKGRDLYPRGVVRFVPDLWLGPVLKGGGDLYIPGGGLYPTGTGGL